MKSVYMVAVVALSSVFAQAAMADIVYNVDQTIGAGSVIGTITTDGTIGVLTDANLLDWDLTANDGAGTASLLGPLSGDNSGINVSGDDLTATATELDYNFNNDGSIVLIYSYSTCSPPEWALDSSSGAAPCNGASGTEQAIAAVGGFASVPESGQVAIGTAAAPEPSSVTMMLAGAILTLGASLHNRKRLSKDTQFVPGTSERLSAS